MVRTVISLFAMFIAIAFSTVAYADWTVLREDDILRGDGIDGMLQDVYFMDSQNGLVVGDGGLVLVTSDGGKTWEKKEIDMRPPGGRTKTRRSSGWSSGRFRWWWFRAPL